MSQISSNENWKSVLNLLQQELDQSSFDSWIKPIKFLEVNGNILKLLVPSLFLKNWISLNYKDSIFINAKNIFTDIVNIDLIVSSFNEDTNQKDVTLEVASNINQNHNFNYQNNTPQNTQIMDIKLDESYTFENFVVGKSNEFAYSAAKRVAEDSKIHFNPLFLHGGVGLGKTHLIQSIAWYITKNFPSRKFLYLSAEKFVNMFVQSLKNKDMINFKDMFRSTDVLMIDDFQFISGKEQTQEEFFHTLNSLIQQNKQIIFSADKSPSELNSIEDRIISRLQAGLVIDIHSTTYELRVGILESKIANLNIKIPKNVIDFLAHTVTSNVRELEGALKRIIARHELIGQKIDLDMASNAIEDIIKFSNRSITIDYIQKKISEHYNIKLAELNSAKRDKNLAKPRQVAMFLTKQLTNNSLPEIGRKFGGRDHTTVLYAIRKIEEEQKKDINLENDIKFLSKIIKKGN
jgi:chromosomal replication initiator protein